MSRLSDRILRDIGMSIDKRAIYENLLALEEDKERVHSVKLEYGQGLGHGPTSDSMFGRVYWTSNTPLKIGVSVKLTQDFKSLEELQDYLNKRGIPGERAFQYSSASYGIEFEEYDFDVHFGLDN